MGAGCVLCDDVFYVDACALVYFQFHPLSVGQSVCLSIPALCRDKKVYRRLSIISCLQETELNSAIVRVFTLTTQ